MLFLIYPDGKRNETNTFFAYPDGKRNQTNALFVSRVANAIKRMAFDVVLIETQQNSLFLMSPYRNAIEPMPFAYSDGKRNKANGF